MRNPNCKCEVCNKKLYRRPSDFKKFKHICCKECRSVLYKKNPEIFENNFKKGHGWNKGMSKKNGDILLYGRPRSQKTKNKMSISAKIAKPVNPNNHIIVQCLFCGKDIKTYKSRYEHGCAKFCSKSCLIKFYNNKRDYIYMTGSNSPRWKGGIKPKNCLICNSIYYSKNKNSKYCSNKCRYKGQSLHMINSHHMVKKIGTDIEIILEKWLIGHNIIFEKQKIIKDISTPDFFILPNICLYADGDYWHNLEKKKKRDKWINKTLKEKGYKVIRITGTQIKKGDIKLCNI